MTAELTLRDSSPAWSAEQRALIRTTFANGATDAEFAALLAVAEARNLNPFTKQVYFVKRWDSQKRCETWAVQVSIDGLRAIAERTGLYAGQDEPEYEYEDNGAIRLCKVRVYRKDWGGRACVGVAHWREYVQLSREGKPTSMWAKYAHIMIAKCAEALALRKAFPEAASGLYTSEEIPIEQPQRVDVEQVHSAPAGIASGERFAASITSAAAPVVVETASVAPAPLSAELEAEARYQGGPSAPQTPAANGRDPRSAPSFQRLLNALEKSVDGPSAISAWMSHGHELAQDGSDVLSIGLDEACRAYNFLASAHLDRNAFKALIKAAREAADRASPESTPADTKPRTKSRKTAAAPLAASIDCPSPSAWEARIGRDHRAGHIAGGFWKRAELWRAEGTLARARSVTVDRLCTLLGRDESDASRWLDGCAPEARRNERREAETDRRRSV